MFRVIILSLLASTCLAKEKKLILDTFFGSHSTVPHLGRYNLFLYSCFAWSVYISETNSTFDTAKHKSKSYKVRI